MARTGTDENKTANAQMAAIQQDKDNRIKGYESMFAGDANKLRNGQDIAADPFKKPEYLQNQNILAAGTSSAINNSAKEALNTEAARTGANTAGRSATIADLGRQKMRTMTDYNAGRAAQDYDKNLDWQKMILGTDLAPAGIDTSMFATATQGRDSALKNLADIGMSQNAMWSNIIGSGLQAGGTAGAAFCPAEGSLYLMADGTEKPVEALVVGDAIQGIDGEPQAIEEIQSAITDIIETRTDDGSIVRNSLSHAFALPKGGFVVAVKSLGKLIATAGGTSKVVSVERVGQALVFNVITDGSHTYRADGVWALGVGDAERHVDMKTWGIIGRKLAKAV